MTLKSLVMFLCRLNFLKHIYCFWWFEEGCSLSHIHTQVEYLLKLFKDRRWDSLVVVSLGLSLFLFALTACYLGINSQLLFPCHSYMPDAPSHNIHKLTLCAASPKLNYLILCFLNCFGHVYLFGFCWHIKIKVTTTSIKYDSFIQHLSWTLLF